MGSDIADEEVDDVDVQAAMGDGDDAPHDDAPAEWSEEEFCLVSE